MLANLSTKQSNVLRMVVGTVFLMWPVDMALAYGLNPEIGIHAVVHCGAAAAFGGLLLWLSYVFFTDRCDGMFITTFMAAPILTHAGQGSPWILAIIGFVITLPILLIMDGTRRDPPFSSS